MGDKQAVYDHNWILYDCKQANVIRMLGFSLIQTNIHTSLGFIKCY